MTGQEQIAGRYQQGLFAYRQAVQNLEPGLEADALRLESQYESLRDWSLVADLNAIRQWFLDQRQACPMRVSDIPLEQCRGWRLDPRNGFIGHQSGEFFYVQGLHVSGTGGREVAGRDWDQPMLTQVGFDGGILGLLRQRRRGIPHYLIEAKAEPGNYHLVQMSPTLQATFSNLKRAHQGNKPRFAEFFEAPEANHANVLYRQWLSEDGGRLYNKRNLGMLVEVPEDMPIEAPPAFAWLSLYQIKACLHENAWVNPHIRGIIAHL